MKENLAYIKECLFDAPAEVKAAYNEVVKYFDLSSRELRRILDKSKLDIKIVEPYGDKDYIIEYEGVSYWVGSGPDMFQVFIMKLPNSPSWPIGKESKDMIILTVANRFDESLKLLSGWTK